MLWRCLLVLGLFGCGNSHVDLFGEDASTARDATADAVVPPTDAPPVDAAGCAGPAPLCFDGWSGSSDCCLEPGSLASCGGTDWICPPGTFLAAECGRFDPVCESVDAGPGPGLYDDCAVMADCTLVARMCCDVCGMPEARNVIGVNVDRSGDYRTDTCADEGDPICPECPIQINPYLAAYCDSSGFRPACGVADFSTDEFRACSSDSDCVLATARCCACGDIPAFETFAVHKDRAVDDVLCDPGVDCPDCEPAFGPNLQAVCDEGYCLVRRDDG